MKLSGFILSALCEPFIYPPECSFSKFPPSLLTPDHRCRFLIPFESPSNACEGAEINAKDLTGKDALMHAALVGRLPSVEMLLKRRADPTLVDEVR